MRWLEKLINRVFKFIPRLKLITPDEGGVRITLGSHVTTLKSGWFIYWPLIQTVPVIAIMPQCPDVRPQSVTDCNGEGLAVSVAVKYRIRDAKAAILSVQDYDTNLQALACGCTTEYCSKHSLVELRDTHQMGDYVASRLQKEARGWGIEIMAVFVTDIGETINLRLLQ